jgi:hypothetical protein
MDEVFGYLPPHPGNPPTKKPMLSLLKQARAFGLGLVLATQNPVDLDYKALSNAGTWFIGRMQADRDKQRLLDGLEGVQVGQKGPSRSELDHIISALKSRVFLLHNVHEDRPVIFHTRWAMSYLRGPLTRSQVQELAAEQPAPPAPDERIVQGQPSDRPAPADTRPEPDVVLPYGQVPPQLPSSVKQVFLPARVRLEAALAQRTREIGWVLPPEAERQQVLVYEPALLGLAQMRYAHTKSRQTHAEEVAYLLPVGGEGHILDWSEARLDLEAADLERQPEREALFADLPPELGNAKHYTAMEKEFDDHLYYNSSITLLYNEHVELYSEPGENAESFQRRCRKAAEKEHEEDAKVLKDKYKRKLDRLEDKLRREEQELEEDKAEHSARKQEELLSGIESVASLFSGRRMSRRLSSASRKRRMTQQAKADIEESEEVIEELEEDIETLEAEAKGELDELAEKWAALIDEVEEIEVRPRRADVRVNLFALAWVPRWEVRAAGQVLTLPAFQAEPV